MDIKPILSIKPLDDLIERLNKVDAVVNKVAHDALARAQAAMTGPKSGRIYKRGTAKKGQRGKGGRFLKAGSQITHQASAKGEAPAKDKGFLALSGFAKRIGKTLWRVGFSANYAKTLEEDRDRPFLGPAVRFVEKPLLRAIEAVFKTKE